MNDLSRTLKRDAGTVSVKTAHTCGFVTGFFVGVITVVGAIAAWIALEAS